MEQFIDFETYLEATDATAIPDPTPDFDLRRDGKIPTKLFAFVKWTGITGTSPTITLAPKGRFQADDANNLLNGQIKTHDETAYATSKTVVSATGSGSQLLQLRSPNDPQNEWVAPIVYFDVATGGSITGGTIEIKLFGR